MPSTLRAAAPLLAVAVALSPAARGAPAPGRAGFASKGGLSLTVTLDKKAYRPGDEVKLAFKLRNETDKVLFVGDGFLAPGYHEAGPGRHFEVHVTADKKRSLNFWAGMLSMCEAAGSRRVFKLKPGGTYEGSVVLRTFAGGRGGGSFADKATHKAHALGKDGRKYSVALRYQVNPKSHGVWEPPADFKAGLLWTGELTTTPLPFEVAGE